MIHRGQKRVEQDTSLQHLLTATVSKQCLNGGLYNYRVGSEANVCKYTLPVMLDGDIGVYSWDVMLRLQLL